MPGLSGVDARLAEAPRWGAAQRGSEVKEWRARVSTCRWIPGIKSRVCVCARAPAGRENSPAPSLTWSWLEVKWLSQQLSAHPSLGVGASIRIAPNLPVPVAENPAQDLLCLPEALGGGVAGRLSGPDR